MVVTRAEALTASLPRRLSGDSSAHWLQVYPAATRNARVYEANVALTNRAVVHYAVVQITSLDITRIPKSIMDTRFPELAEGFTTPSSHYVPSDDSFFVRPETVGVDMKIGWNIGYWAGNAPPGGVEEALMDLEARGLDSFWTAEAYGSDAMTPLAWWGSRTRNLRIGSAIAQIPARTPAATAMAAMTLDQLSGGRMVLGLGVSGPQVAEGWYGQPFAAPLQRTREYVSVLRQVWAREKPMRSAGRHYPVPFESGTGLGKPLMSLLHPVRSDIPVMLAAEGPRNVALAAEIADGWLAFLFSPREEDRFRSFLDEGFTRRGDQRTADGFEVVANVPVSLGDDLAEAARPIQQMLALYVGGMGARQANFHFDVLVRMGYEAVAREVQRHYLDGQRDRASDAVPMELVDAFALVGDEARIRDGVRYWQRSLVSTLLLQGPPETVQRAAEILLATEETE